MLLGHFPSLVRKPSKWEKDSTPVFPKTIIFPKERDPWIITRTGKTYQDCLPPGEKTQDLNPKLCPYSHWMVLRPLKAVWHFRKSRDLPSGKPTKIFLICINIYHCVESHGVCMVYQMLHASVYVSVCKCICIYACLCICIVSACIDADVCKCVGRHRYAYVDMSA